MPDTTVKDKKTEKDDEEKEEDDIGSMSAFFMVEIKDPSSDGLRISRRNICFVEIRPES